MSGRSPAADVGARFGRLTVLAIDGQKRLCRCDCGTEKRVPRNGLTAGYTRSCGCLYRESRKTSALKHGGATDGKHTKAYKAWVAIRQRCLNPNDARWASYGGRGITMSAPWRESFETFLSDMGEPTPGQSIERVDNNGPYAKENCIWATPSAQARNTRRNRFLTFAGRTMTATDWANEIGVRPNTLMARLRLGWSPEEALTGNRHV